MYLSHTTLLSPHRRFSRLLRQPPRFSFLGRTRGNHDSYAALCNGGTLARFFFFFFFISSSFPTYRPVSSAFQFLLLYCAACAWMSKPATWKPMAAS
ncbi:hypothetical protein I7I48_11248 [Histoplasma ohiense]|nr:hypothetical protein I7I48_11248 [Histoplasma ohiense (nom. inval.)]